MGVSQRSHPGILPDTETGMRKLETIPKFMHEALLDNGWKDGQSRWSDYEIFDCWLKWEGIIGWTDSILEALEFIKPERYKG